MKPVTGRIYSVLFAKFNRSFGPSVRDIQFSNGLDEPNDVYLTSLVSPNTGSYVWLIESFTTYNPFNNYLFETDNINVGDVFTLRSQNSLNTFQASVFSFNLSQV